MWDKRNSPVRQKADRALFRRAQRKVSSQKKGTSTPTQSRVAIWAWRLGWMGLGSWGSEMPSLSP